MLRSCYCSSTSYFAITSEVQETTHRSYLAPIILDEKFDMDLCMDLSSIPEGDFGYILLGFSEEKPQS
ncbi:unnamed protein product [Larinioides sclopetarius]|uniref:Uncharacterized protein n=1 Tax=Larinioides sclopetarius TaxID=280406 RepID=A0AAV1ZJ80_9ARAC